LIGVETIHEQLAGARVQSYTLLRKDIAWSGLSEMHCTGADVIPFVSAPDMFVTIRRLLQEARPARKAIWAYWDALDRIQHQYGVWQEEGEAELWAFASAMKRELLDPLKKMKTNTTLIFTADHGHVQVNRNDIFQIKTVPRTDDALRVPPSGTSRAGYLNTVDEEWVEVLRKKLSSEGWVLPTSDLVAQGLWGNGEPKPEFRGRVGDYVFIMRDRRVSFYPYYSGASPEHQLGGRHGGLHEEEMLTPFIIRRV
jgi:arylsulfatase A-like enzyme